MLLMLILSLGGVSGPPGGKCMCAENTEWDATTGLLQGLLPASGHSLRVVSS